MPIKTNHIKAYRSVLASQRLYGGWEGPSLVVGEWWAAVGAAFAYSSMADDDSG